MTTGPEPFDEEVPIADALEQRQALDEEPPGADGTPPPAESDPADWQEQVADAGPEDDDYDRAQRPGAEDA
ncbi:hypothetical protein LV457_05160 [Mycobacterium sp. MYCO198283]|uniref:hypothetical protein n=1 Tax=Mycobacterium sp. MYCO198283 TaxID=2883505 RepID=UPI001E45A90F|nr:hypothetical protein [Mycobacterium sp. MYCO198283]MCG5431681.1 hypothetical protein [Mycobacterium sp. MYCO198283]